MSNKELTPFYKANEHKPVAVGPYQCIIRLAGGAPESEKDKEAKPKHMRWWDGGRWSLPLSYDPDLDAKIEEPQPEHYPDPNYYDMSDYHAMFEWRGFTEDQDPL